MTARLGALAERALSGDGSMCVRRWWGIRGRKRPEVECVVGSQRALVIDLRLVAVDAHARPIVIFRSIHAGGHVVRRDCRAVGVACGDEW